MNLIVTSRLMANAALLASTLLTACGLRCTSPSTETFTVYEDAPMLKLLDLGTPGNSPATSIIFLLRYTLLPMAPSQARYLARRR